MLQGSRGLEPDFSDPQELLYRRCDPAHTEAGRVLPIAVEQFNLSVLRSQFCSNPDHARWDSRVGAKDGQAFVYPDWLVIEFSVADALLTRTPENATAQVHTLGPPMYHSPTTTLILNYGYSKASRPRGLPRKATPKGRASSPRSSSGRCSLTKRSIRLQSNEDCSFVPNYDWRSLTRRGSLRVSPHSSSRRVGTFAGANGCSGSGDKRPLGTGQLDERS